MSTIQHGTTSGYSHHCRCEACTKAVREYNQSRKIPENCPDDLHGTIGAYNNYRCRCGACRGAWNAYMEVMKERLARALTPDRVHGTENGYGNYRCRCAECTEAHNAANRSRYRRRVEVAA